MTIQTKKLVEIYQDIRDEIMAVLSNDEDLTEIEEVVFGERQRIGSLRKPSIWIVPNPYNPDLTAGRTATHDIPFDFVVFIQSHDPQEGLQKAQDLAMITYDVLVKDRTLNSLVSDVRPTRVDPAYEASNANQLYFSAVQMTYRLKRRE